MLAKSFCINLYVLQHIPLLLLIICQGMTDDLPVIAGHENIAYIFLWGFYDASPN